MDAQYRELTENEICRDLFSHFIRRQKVVKCWRRDGGKWVIKDDRRLVRSGLWDSDRMPEKHGRHGRIRIWILLRW